MESAFYEDDCMGDVPRLTTRPPRLMRRMSTNYTSITDQIMVRHDQQQQSYCGGNGGNGGNGNNSGNGAQSNKQNSNMVSRLSCMVGLLLSGSFVKTTKHEIDHCLVLMSYRPVFLCENCPDGILSLYMLGNYRTTVHHEK